MKGDPRSMTVLRPLTPEAAVRDYERHPKALPLAGGTDLMVAWNAGLLNRAVMLDLSALSAWRGVKLTKSGLRVGALTTHAELRDHPLVLRHFPLLARACGVVGGVQIQNRGTLGGNIANASPAGDTFPPLALYEPRVHTLSPAGRRTLRLAEVFRGVKKTNLGPAELIEAVELPFLPSRPTRQLFRKVGTRAAQAISKTVAAGLFWLDARGAVKELRFALGSMAPTVRRLTSVEAFVLGKRLTPDVVAGACALVGRDVSPIDDIRSTAEYRLHVSQNILKDFLEAR